MPVTVIFNPAVLSQQSQVINDATPNNDGVMTKEQAAQLSGLSKGAWQRSIVQPADGTDFIVTIPAAQQLGTANYRPSVLIQTANIFTGIAIPFANQTATQFRVTTDGALPNGTILSFSLEKLA